ncbi:amino acid permease [Flavobacteriaceae bacterium TP-CH-4]|uniref:Amino acid permease n=1 Tax=Pelagihabitans pacificus TaxID=2696054 RepID=A0A967AT72_9FLAO|nr:amino acid permease [Pelagihabitans pacificus]NHF59939.1 amino acid permease [Pelagihabitans pacificus]
MTESNSIGLPTATAIVVANMIGAGIFTSLGFQLMDTTNSWSILILWSLGALMALCGALSYAEIATYWKRSGGEYHFLSKAFHPLLGYLSGWVSLTIGFSAPIALSAMALGAYIGPYLGIPEQVLAVFTIVIISVFHSMSIKRSSILQNTSTLLKILLIILLLYFGLTRTPVVSAFLWDGSWKQELFLPAFAVSFVFVTFSYSGWNAAAYIVDEIREARKTLPRALLLGTAVVSLLYLLLNYVFLRQNPLETIKGELEIGQLTAISLFGEKGGEMISFGIALMLISSISAMVWAGPRVTQVMGEDHALWRWFSLKTKRAIPLRAIWLQTAITLLLLFTGTFEQVMVYSGFVLQLFAALAVSAVFVVRRKSNTKSGFRSPLFPIPQIIFLILSVWVLVYLVFAQPLETGLGILNLVVGFLVYKTDGFYGKRQGLPS